MARGKRNISVDGIKAVIFILMMFLQKKYEHYGRKLSHTEILGMFKSKFVNRVLPKSHRRFLSFLYRRTAMFKRIQRLGSVPTKYQVAVVLKDLRME